MKDEEENRQDQSKRSSKTIAAGSAATYCPCEIPPETVKELFIDVEKCTLSSIPNICGEEEFAISIAVVANRNEDNMIFHTYIDCPREIAADGWEVHGITKEQMKRSMKLAGVHDYLKKLNLNGKRKWVAAAIEGDFKALGIFGKIKNYYDIFEHYKDENGQPISLENLRYIFNLDKNLDRSKVHDCITDARTTRDLYNRINNEDYKVLLRHNCPISSKDKKKRWLARRQERRKLQIDKKY